MEAQIVGMNLDSRDTFSVDNDLHDDNSSTGEKLDLNHAVSKERGEVYGHESEAWGDRSQVDASHQHLGSSLLHDVPNHKSSSQVQCEMYNDNERTEDIDFNKEGLDSYRDVEFESAKVGYFDKPSSPVEATHFQSELQLDDPVQYSLELSEGVDSNNKLDDMKETIHHSEILMDGSDKVLGSLQQEQTESAYETLEQAGSLHRTQKEYSSKGTLMEDEWCSRKLKSSNGDMEGRNADVHALGRPPKRSASPMRETSVSPERSPVFHEKRPSPLCGHDSPYSPRSSRRKVSPSSERNDGDGRRVLSEDRSSPSARQKSPSPSRQSRRTSPRRNESLRKRLSSSPRRRQLSPDRRREGRSVSPTRHRDSSYGSGRDHRDRSRSRSPYAIDCYRRSPRRYSPRHRSRPGYHTRRHSPRRKPWSPPRNRNNGVGRPGNNLFVAGFSFATTERDLDRKFSRFGRVRDVRIVRDKRSGDSRGFGFLSLGRDEDADAAIRALDQTDWNGRVVLVEKSKSR